MATFSLKRHLLKSRWLKAGSISPACAFPTMCYLCHVYVRVRWARRHRWVKPKTLHTKYYQNWTTPGKSGEVELIHIQGTLCAWALPSLKWEWNYYPSEALVKIIIIHLRTALKASTATLIWQTLRDLALFILPLKPAPGQHQETHNAGVAMSESHRRWQGFIQLLWAKMSQFLL